MSDVCFFFFKQKPAYEMRISDWSSDVCSSDLSVVSHSSVRARLSHGHQTKLNLPTSSGAFDGFVASDVADLSARPAFALGGACGAAPPAAAHSSVKAGNLLSRFPPSLLSHHGPPQSRHWIVTGRLEDRASTEYT